MDLSFVSGPFNLEYVSASVNKPKLTVKQSRDRHIEFLTIIDVGTRQLWIISSKTETHQRFTSIHF